MKHMKSDDEVATNDNEKIGFALLSSPTGSTFLFCCDVKELSRELDYLFLRLTGLEGMQKDMKCCASLRRRHERPKIGLENLEN